MCEICKIHIKEEIMLALDPIFQRFGQQEVLDIIHDYYHNRHKES